MRRIVSEKYLQRLGIKQDMIEKWDKEIKAVGGVKILSFKAQDVLELFSFAALILGGLLVLTVIGAVNGANVFALLSVFAGSAIMFYQYWRSPIESYRGSFYKEEELPAALEIFISGLEVGMNIDNIIGYIVRTRKGVVRDLLYEAQVRIDTGSSLKDALTFAADKSLNDHFKRFVKAVTGEYESVKDMRENLEELLEEVEEKNYNQKIERAAVLDNSLFFPIFLGYFIPVLIIFALPFVLSLRSFFNLF
ncbi:MULTISPECIES: type II secretion system F family protein [Thermoanaerobacteraceae]|uniref:type II secretion system F family protein n=1 Tax=Thermoanaerobacteraceae TaxID=186814 RepID=UPI000573E03F|nr:type II secretion system F family protein [Thermoanaerobacter sp. YS13]KHO61646.1 type II secretion system protein F (GspF) [Thermoanaerobacter sp. YS13]